MFYGEFSARCFQQTRHYDQPIYKYTPNKRLVIDTAQCNSHGLSLLEFTSDCDLCMLNGRSGVDSNRFAITSVSIHDTFVVDYTLVPVGHFTKFTKFYT